MIVLSFLSLHFIILGYIEITCSFEQRYLLGSIKTVPHYKLNGHQIETVETVEGSTLLSCAQSCLAEPRCISTNFGVSEDNKLVCELNNRDVSLLSNEELTYAEGFTFSLYSSVSIIGTDMKVSFFFFKNI